MPRKDYRSEAHHLAAGRLGHVQGITLLEHDGPSMHYFGGLPYALPPTGQFRFRRPRPLPEGYRYGTKANPGIFNGGCSPRLELDSSLVNEDCLQLNIYLPAGKNPPHQGWPVFFYIHGGFLQFGKANEKLEGMAPLLSETAFEAMIVMPAYRLNLFGFLSSKELQAEAERDGEAAGNMGFWDQRMALEWTAKHIGHFGGDPNNITVGGYSAGGHSAFHQLAHELYYVPDDQAIIKRLICWSNSPGVQPRTVSQHQAQFDELLQALRISSNLSPAEKLERLRQTSSADLVNVQERLEISEFRATTDNAFVSKTLMADVNSGDFGRRMRARGIRLLNGEVMEEHNLYRTWRTPDNSFEALRTRLISDYPEKLVDKIIRHYCGRNISLPKGYNNWQDLFGHIYADLQVYHLERGLYRGLQGGGLRFGRDVLRYRINWRADCVKDTYKVEWGVCHASDLAIWFWGLDFGDGLDQNEKDVLMDWNRAFAAFVQGRDQDWGTKSVKEVKRLRADGITDIWIDDRWDAGLEVWDLANRSTTADDLARRRTSKL